MADAYWKHGSVCEEYSAIQCPVYAVGGWTDGYTNAIPRLLTHLTVPRKGLIGPWAHGVMDEPMLRAWMTESVEPAPHHEKLPGRWIAEPSWPPPNTWVHRLFITDDGLQVSSAELTPRDVCSPRWGERTAVPGVRLAEGPIRQATSRKTMFVSLFDCP